MGRRRSADDEPKKKKLKKKGIAAYRDEMRAVRFVSVGGSDEGFERAKQVMRVSLGKSTGANGVDFYFANGECNDDEAGAIHVSVNGPKRDLVNLMFRAAIRKAGFKIKKGR